VNFTDSPFFSVLRANLSHQGERQKVIAENLANATTPGYVARDTDEKAFGKFLEQAGGASSPRLKMMAPEGALTTGRAITGTDAGAKSTKIVNAPDSETTLDGNAVVLEEQMLKQAETRTDYETSIALYQKGLSLMRLAIKAPGR
jgi:flagellar basal-body rod protein FlgB